MHVICLPVCFDKMVFLSEIKHTLKENNGDLDGLFHLQELVSLALPRLHLFCWF